MNQNLKNMIVPVGVFVFAGIGIFVYTPQPATRKMA